TSTTGARLVRGAIRDAWAGQGWENGRLGYPTSDPQPVTGGTRQTFQGGYVQVLDGARVATVHYT
ncbi:hypothetical protein E9549_07275, partial [Blastococcus sp. MG754426]|uniref:LGFP repeat-containing protein n=1 Tax=unclassified Blastococcus TaxID=2619396 RepID=UPI0035ABD0AF|nr:hypothetical protein [Blastococcus sp. MG754426]MCF6513933.1 hypothetical protein [Blastococcus sp. MG754427]